MEIGLYVACFCLIFLSTACTAAQMEESEKDILAVETCVEEVSKPAQ